LVTDGNGNVVSDYVYGGSSIIARLDSNGNPIYYLTDSMGSVIGLVNGDGNLVSRIVYDGFGNVESGDDGSSLGGDFRFQGQWLESESGLYYMRARDYDAETGLFLSRDPVDMQEQGVEAFNPYQFAFNNPFIYSDPTGMFTIAELNVANRMQDILRTYVNNEAKDFLRQQTGEIFSNVALGIIDQILPGTIDGDALFNIGGTSQTFGGDYLELFLEESFCKLLPQSLKDRLWLTPQIQQDGTVSDIGYKCNQPKTGKINASNPDFLFEEGSPKPVKSNNPQSYLVGDVKFTLSQAYSTMIKTKGQWTAMSNHARDYQFSRFTSYITFRWTTNKGYTSTLPQYVAATLKDMQEIAFKKNVVLFVVNIFD
jgi:RHS repeat-associated protein